MAKNEMNKAKEQRIYRVAIFTPYLLETMGDLANWGIKDGRCPIETIARQIAKYGYDPDNLNNIKTIKTKNGMVVLETPQDHGSEMPILGIIGNTESSEDHVKRISGSGLLFARYSIFYGKPSGYTENKPEDVGYSLDIPKDVSTVKALLEDDRTLEAFLLREEKGIRKAIKSLNNKLNHPILITSYLAEALRRH